MMTRTVLCGALMGVLWIAGCDAAVPPGKPAASSGGVSVYFSPETDCRKLIIEQIRGAQKRIHVQAYSFTSDKIARALADSHKLGVEVIVIVDADKVDKKSELGYLTKRGIDTYVDSEHDKAHSKVILIDGEKIITGSFNFNDADEDGTSDNVLVIEGKADLSGAYEKNFQVHLAHSKRYTKKD